MNKYISAKAFITLLTLVFICTNCMKEIIFHPPEEIKKVFIARFSEYSDLEWSSRKGFVVADFRSKEGYHTKAWFSTASEWVMTETMGIPYSKLPDEIIKDNNIEHIMSTSEVEFENIETRYVIKRIPINKPEFRFYRKKDRELFKTEHGTWENEPIIIPELTLKHIKEYNSNSDIIDGWVKDTILKLHVAPYIPYEFLCFKTTGEWIANYSEIKKENKKTYEKVMRLLKKNFPDISDFSSFLVEYPENLAEHNSDKQAYFIRTNKRDFFIDRTGEELTDIPQNVKAALAGA